MKKFLKHLLFRNRWSDFEIISQESGFDISRRDCFIPAVIATGKLPSPFLSLPVKVKFPVHFNQFGSLLSILVVFSSTGRRPASLCHGLLSVVRPSVRALTFSLNIFSETTNQILMKFHRNVPAMVLFRIS